MPELDWNDLRYVLAVARARTVAGAALRLRVNESTVIRRIARAEQSLKARLFARSQGEFSLTDMGNKVVSRSTAIEREIELLTDESRADSGVAGSVRISATPLIVNRLLVPSIHILIGAHPELKVELVSEPRNESLVRRDAEVAIRMARPNIESKALTKRIGLLPYAVYGPSKERSDSLPWVRYTRERASLVHSIWMDREIERLQEEACAITVYDSEIALHAVKAGLGKSVLPCVVGDDEPTLKRLSGRTPIFNREIWLLYLPELRPLARVRAVIDWLERLRFT